MVNILITVAVVVGIYLTIGVVLAALLMQEVDGGRWQKFKAGLIISILGVASVAIGIFLDDISDKPAATTDSTPSPEEE